MKEVQDSKDRRIQLVQILQFLLILSFYYFLDVSPSLHTLPLPLFRSKSSFTGPITTLSQLGSVFHALPPPNLPPNIFYFAVNDLSKIFIHSLHKYL